MTLSSGQRKKLGKRSGNSGLLKRLNKTPQCAAMNLEKENQDIEVDMHMRAQRCDFTFMILLHEDASNSPATEVISITWIKLAQNPICIHTSVHTGRNTNTQTRTHPHADIKHTTYRSTYTDPSCIKTKQHNTCQPGLLPALPSHHVCK